MSGGLSYDEKRARFCDWLKENGARYPKIQWPSLDTVGGCRGAKAIETINTGEVMMEIPIKLMMSPVHAFADPVVGTCLKSSQDLLRGDVLLTVYIMYEILKGSDSFYEPFIAILPEPGSIVQWTEEELRALQDDSIAYRAHNRRKMLRTTYQKSIVALCERFPDVFNVEQYTHDLFLFAWFCIQARAFGRRLPWTALVPFADCLNHANVATKYDYNIDNNGIFRMMPTGTNSYQQGSEVFNSYGRRPNDNLLLDYGFSLLDNQWDALILPLALPSPTEMNHDIEPFSDAYSIALTEYNYEKKIHNRKKRMLFHMGYHIHNNFNLQRTIFPLDALSFCRLTVMNEQELIKGMCSDLLIYWILRYIYIFYDPTLALYFVCVLCKRVCNGMSSSSNSFNSISLNDVNYHTGMLGLITPGLRVGFSMTRHLPDSILIE